MCTALVIGRDKRCLQWTCGLVAKVCGFASSVCWEADTAASVVNKLIVTVLTGILTLALHMRLAGVFQQACIGELPSRLRVRSRGRAVLDERVCCNASLGCSMQAKRA